MKVLSVSAMPKNPVVGQPLQLAVCYQVKLNNIHVFCTAPTGLHIEPNEINPPDDAGVVTANIYIEDARSGQYQVSIASLVDEPNCDEGRINSTESLSIQCSGVCVCVCVGYMVHARNLYCGAYCCMNLSLFK